MIIALKKNIGVDPACSNIAWYGENQFDFARTF